MGASYVRRESINSIDLHQQHLSPLTSIEQNTRVLTLAEQIIAAIPDRIKVRIAGPATSTICIGSFFLNKNVARFFFMKCAERDGGDGRRLESVHGIGEQRRQRSAERRRLNRPGHRRRRAFPRRQRFDVRV